MDGRDDILNIIAGRIANYIKGIKTGPCELCEKSGLTEYKGNCIGYSWDLTYFPPAVAREPGTWNFSLSRHRKEIWYATKDGTVTDIILNVYEKLVSGEWKKDIEEDMDNIQTGS